MDQRQLGRTPPALRLGAVSYVNALPLIFGLKPEPWLELRALVPSEVACGLAEGTLDAGLVPVVELLRQPTLSVVSDACIGALGPVDSVLLLLRTDPSQVREVVLDPHSRTSQVLALIILRELYGVTPTFRYADPIASWQSGEAAAVLMSGDPALRAFSRGEPALDLSEAWTRLTGLPFVFAVWAARGLGDQDTAQLAGVLECARDLGVASPEPLALACTRMPDIPRSLMQTYLAKRIRYTLGSAERAGLAAFLERATPWVSLMANQGRPR
ncbi:MAG TPA: menaquinone biosynthesis protein [Planctomycetota bacterium]|nr:menaquinone biosynthesis protein [Planctomycetota bacterium]